MYVLSSHYNYGSGFEKFHPEEWAYTLGKRLSLPKISD